MTTPSRARLPSLDYLKAGAIVAVTFTHALPSAFTPDASPFNRIAIVLSTFHVPAFLLAAGFLATSKRPADLQFVGERLLRILVPYLVATAVALLIGEWDLTTLRKAVFVVVTGSAIGIYYFIPALACCFVLLPVLSRLPTPVLGVLTVALGVYAQVARFDPSWRWSQDLFWAIRDPFVQFHLGHFALGILAARRVAELRRLQARWPRLVLGVSAAVVASAIWLALTHFTSAWQPMLRTTYMLSVLGLVVSLAPAGPAPKPVRFLSDATLAIYLYHIMVYPLVPEELRAFLGAPLQLLVMSAVGLGFGTLVVLAGRRLFGSRSRLLLGA